MACILGYSANASAIELHPSDDGVLDHTAVKAAAAFWLIIKLTRGILSELVVAEDVVVVLLIYAWKLPKFRTAQSLSAIAVFIPMLIYLVSDTTVYQLTRSL